MADILFSFIAPYQLGIDLQEMTFCDSSIIGTKVYLKRYLRFPDDPFQNEYTTGSSE